MLRKIINFFFRKDDEIISSFQPIPLPMIDTEVVSFGDYQKKAFTTAMYPEKGTGSVLALSYVGLGLGEVGEIQGKLKKIIRDNKGIITPEVKEAIVLECSDTLWYLSALCTELGVSLDEVAQKNLDKLFSRKIRGKITGSGDNR